MGERSNESRSIRISISFKRDDPQQMFILQYLKDLKNGEAAAVLAKFLPLGIMAYQNRLFGVKQPGKPSAVQSRRTNVRLPRALDPIKSLESLPDTQPEIGEQAKAAPEPVPSLSSDDNDIFLLNALDKFNNLYEQGK